MKPPNTFLDSSTKFNFWEIQSAPVPHYSVTDRYYLLHYIVNHLLCRIAPTIFIKVKANSDLHGNERADAAPTKKAHANLQLTTLDAPHSCQTGHGPIWLKAPNPASADGLFITQPKPTAWRPVGNLETDTKSLI